MQSEATAAGPPLEVHLSGQRHRLHGREATIGRHPGADLHVDHDGVSRRHAVLRPGPGGWELIDVGSSNGTWVDGQRISQLPITSRTTVHLGRPSRGVPLELVPVGTGPNGTDGRGTDGAGGTDAAAGYLERTNAVPLGMPPGMAAPAAAARVGFAPPAAVPPGPDGQAPGAGRSRGGRGQDRKGRKGPRSAGSRPERRSAGGRRPSSGRYRGVARGIQTRSEMFGQGQSRQIITFRVERHDDQGNRLPPVPVELRAYWLSGQIADGEEVEVSGRMKRGVLRVRRIHNLTTGAIVEQSRGKTGLMWVMGVIVVLFLVAIAVGFVVFLQNQPDFGPPEGFGQ